MAFGRRNSEPRSWAGETAAEQAARGSGSGGGGKCDPVHEKPVFLHYEWRKSGGKHGKETRYALYECRACGASWEHSA
jgi:hypothetical protein